MADYSAIVLYFRAGEILGRTLDRLLHQTRRPTEILVVDNASNDGVAARMVAERPGVRLLQLESNAGYAGGMNHGVGALTSNSTHLLFLTHEAELAVDAAGWLLGSAVERAASACGPLLSRHRDDSIWSAGGSLSERGATSHLQAPAVVDSAYSVDWLDGAVMMIDRIAFDAIGGFDERYFLYWEDVDVSVRLQTYGAVLVEPRARALQETGSTPPYYAARNRVLFWRLHGGWISPVRAVVGEIESALRDLARRRPGFRDAGGRLLGLVDGVAGGLHPRWAKLRTARS